MSAVVIDSGSRLMARSTAALFDWDQADPWERMLVMMPALALLWIAVASCWSARIAGLI